MKQYRDKLLDKGIRQSMSRKGNGKVCLEKVIVTIIM